MFFDVGRRRRPEPFLLAVSTLHPHKNLDGLLRAFAIFRQEHPDFRLVVCGMHGFFTGPLHELREQPRAGAMRSSFRAGFRARIFTTCSRGLRPSSTHRRFEGFGLPVLEALAAGVPTACSNIEPLSTIAGDAALRFDPGDVDAIASAMCRLVDDAALRERLSAAGPRAGGGVFVGDHGGWASYGRIEQARGGERG